MLLLHSQSRIAWVARLPRRRHRRVVDNSPRFLDIGYTASRSVDDDIRFRLSAFLRHVRIMFPVTDVKSNGGEVNERVHGMVLVLNSTNMQLNSLLQSHLFTAMSPYKIVKKK